MGEAVQVTYFPTITVQTQYFLYSLLLGAGLGFIYDVLRSVRIAVRDEKRARFYFSDVLVFVIAVFLFEIFTVSFGYGVVRYYALSGVFLGALFYLNTIGLITVKIERKIAKLYQKLIGFFIVKPIHLLYNCFKKFLVSLQFRKKGTKNEEQREKE